MRVRVRVFRVSRGTGTGAGRARADLTQQLAHLAPVAGVAIGLGAQVRRFPPQVRRDTAR